MNSDVNASSLREEIRSYLQIRKLEALIETLSVAFDEFYSCGYRQSDCLHALSSYLHHDGLLVASRLVEEAAIALEEQQNL